MCGATVPVWYACWVCLRDGCACWVPTCVLTLLCICVCMCVACVDICKTSFVLIKQHLPKAVDSCAEAGVEATETGVEAAKAGAEAADATVTVAGDGAVADFTNGEKSKYCIFPL